MNSRVAVYIFLFILTTGLATFGILASIMLRNRTKDPVFQSLVYRQIFTFSFFIYAIWGNILARELIKSLNLDTHITPFVSFFIPFIGIPFLVIDWYMLLKIFFKLLGKELRTLFSVIYFVFFTIILLVATFLFRGGTPGVNSHPEIILVQSIVCLNLAVHLALFFIALSGRLYNDIPRSELKKRLKLLIYFTGVVIYSAGFWYLHKMPVLLQTIPLLAVFLTNALLPLLIVNIPQPYPTDSINQSIPILEKFCEKYDISKRETEIIREIISGKSNQEIADKLFITLQTVKDHVHRIYQKTGIKNRVQLINLVNKL